MEKLIGSILLAVVLLTGCGWDMPETIYINPGLETHEQEIAVEAVKSWSKSLGREIDVVIGESASTYITRANERCDPELGWANLNKVGGSGIHICPGLSESRLRMVMRHELGHLLSGRDDHLPPGHVMSTRERDTVQELTQGDIDYVGVIISKDKGYEL